MSDVVEKTRPLDALSRSVSALRVFGGGAILRRALALIDAYSRKVHGASTLEADSPNCRPCHNGGPRSFTFDTAFDEHREEDGRRSVMVDPREAVATHLIDFFSGRLRSVEFRSLTSSLELEEIVRDAKGLIRGRVPVVRVNYEAAESTQEIVGMLRALADEIECGSTGEVLINLANHADDLHLVAALDQCSPLRSDVVSSRFTNGGKTLEYLYQDILRCSRRDNCCGNVSYYEKPGGQRWQVVWTDGNTTTPPPQLPPNFPTQPWNNQVSLFQDNSNTHLTSDWGWRSLNGQSNFHGGIDIAGPVGRDVTSPVSGVVLIAPSDSWQNSGVVIRAGDQTYTFWHIDPSVAQGAQVQAGDVVGSIRAGSSAAEPPHLHYGVHRPPNPNDAAERNDANSVNPLP